MAPLPVYRLLIVYPEEAVNNEVKKTLFPVLGILLLEITWASIYGARSMLCRCKDKTDRVSLWGNQLVARRGFNKACVAMAARLARLCWILIQKNQPYQAM